MDMTKSDHLELMRESAKTFPKIESPSSVRTARIWHCAYRSLAPVSELVNLEEIVIGSLPDSSLEFLCNLSKLRYLRIVHMPKITDLTAIEKLKNLEVLSLSTSPSWDAAKKCTIVDSLKPIAQLPKLKELELFGVCSNNKSLVDLQSSPSLRSVRVSQYPKSESERFYLETSLQDAFADAASFE